MQDFASNDAELRTPREMHAHRQLVPHGDKLVRDRGGRTEVVPHIKTSLRRIGLISLCVLVFLVFPNDRAKADRLRRVHSRSPGENRDSEAIAACFNFACSRNDGKKKKTPPLGCRALCVHLGNENACCLLIRRTISGCHGNTRFLTSDRGLFCFCFFVY